MGKVIYNEVLWWEKSYYDIQIYLYDYLVSIRVKGINFLGGRGDLC
jgi:hypothetical protein